MNVSRWSIISESVAVIDEKIASMKKKQKSLRSEGGYRKSASPQQYRKALGLNSERYALESLRHRISF